jgi:PhnB protein
MLHDEISEHQGDVSAPARGGTANLSININLPDPAAVDATVTRAAGAGATVTMPPDDMFWGARYGRVRDPFGHVWAFNAPVRSS